MLDALLEYAKLLPKGIKNIDKVAEGIMNKLNHDVLPDDQKFEIAKRKLICATCPYNSVNAVKDRKLKYKTTRVDAHCIHCGCNIELKTECLSCRCGIEAYNKLRPDAPLELKWEQYT